MFLYFLTSFENLSIIYEEVSQYGLVYYLQEQYQLLLEGFANMMYHNYPFFH